MTSRCAAACLALVATLSTALPARADPTAPATAPAEVTLNPKAITHEGVEGLFFSRDEADRVRYYLMDERPRLKRVVDLDSELLSLLETRAKTADEALKTSASVIKAQQDAVSAALEVARSADAWYRSPWLWMTVGAVLAIGAASAGAAIGANTR